MLIPHPLSLITCIFYVVLKIIQYFVRGLCMLLSVHLKINCYTFDNIYIFGDHSFDDYCIVCWPAAAGDG